jgi:outer membrane protein assembly factor BamB
VDKKVNLVPPVLVALIAALVIGHHLSAQETGWLISPTNLNIAQGDDRTLQVLDDSAQELSGAQWFINNPGLADLREENGRLILHSKNPGTVIVTAVLHGERRTRDVVIWPADKTRPLGTVTWSGHPIGRQLGDIAAVPAPDGPNMLSLEQTPAGETYLRGVAEDGIQIWSWHLPEKANDVELVCGDWRGGGLISANHGSNYTIYSVGSDGKLRWQYTLPGSRKGHTIDMDHVVTVVSQSADGMATKLTALNGQDGGLKYDLAIPGSYYRTNLAQTGGAYRCLPDYSNAPVRTIASKPFVSEFGFEYLAFSHNEWTMEAPGCTPGSAVPAAKVAFSRHDQVVLWQIRSDGGYRSTIVEESKAGNPVSNPVSVPSPTGALITDGMGGALLSIRVPLNYPGEPAPQPASEFVYRVDPEGKVLFRVPLPSYQGAIHDAMVLGQNNVGFTTRGTKLIAFDLNSGRELWRWDGGVSGIEVFAALADGGCLVQSPEALIDVHNANAAEEVFKGQAIVDWRGQIYRKSS